MRTVDAFEQARLMRNGWVGPEHFLLALLAIPSVATDALEATGIGYDDVADRMRDSVGDPDVPTPLYDPSKGLGGPNPAGHNLVGRAQGLALAWGYDRPESEHWLIAMIYGDEGLLSMFTVLGATQDQLLSELAARGVSIPQSPPQRFKPWRREQHTYLDPDDLNMVLRVLETHHAPGSEWRWGFNWVSGPPRRARVDTEDGILIDDILGELGIVKRDRPN